MVLISNDKFHAPIKKALDGMGVISQFMLCKNIRQKVERKVFGVFSNLLRQINAKAGLDLYRMHLPQKLRNMPTMIVGVDVVNQGRSCTIGLASTYNQFLH